MVNIVYLCRQSVARPKINKQIDSVGFLLAAGSKLIVVMFNSLVLCVCNLIVIIFNWIPFLFVFIYKNAVCQAHGVHSKVFSLKMDARRPGRSR